MTDTDVRRLLGYRHDARRGMVETLRRLALVESPSDDPAADAPLLAMLASELEGVGMAVRRCPGRVSAGVLAARWPGHRDGVPRQLIVGHCDTVWPIGPLGDMPARVEEETVHGPGVLDMKGGLVQMLFALRALRDLGRRPTPPSSSTRTRRSAAPTQGPSSGAWPAGRPGPLCWSRPSGVRAS